MHTVQDVGGCSELKRGLQPHSQSRRTANALLQFAMEAKGPKHLQQHRELRGTTDLMHPLVRSWPGPSHAMAT